MCEEITDFKTYRQYRRFSDVDAATYAINIFDQGSILSVVVDAGAHGTHVAGIVSAFHPDNPSANGIAPGAQIISLKIGDTRLGSEETGVALCRAMVEARRRGCHVINLSYGEATTLENMGMFADLANELVSKYGILFISSAGNNGPALSTVGCPGGSTSQIMSIGAYAVSSLMEVGYRIAKPDTQTLVETNYTWSSVGPSIDGDFGVSVMAPGGAISSVPLYTHSRNQLMNGTSMSSPNASGCIALLLSAVIGSGLADTYRTPAYIRRIVENSALRIAHVDVLGQGHGLLQVFAAWKAVQRDVALTNVEAGDGDRKASAAWVRRHALLRRLSFCVSFSKVCNVLCMFPSN